MQNMIKGIWRAKLRQLRAQLEADINAALPDSALARVLMPKEMQNYRDHLGRLRDLRDAADDEMYTLSADGEAYRNRARGILLKIRSARKEETISAINKEAEKVAAEFEDLDDAEKAKFRPMSDAEELQRAGNQLQWMLHVPWRQRDHVTPPPKNLRRAAQLEALCAALVEPESSVSVDPAVAGRALRTRELVRRLEA